VPLCCALGNLRRQLWKGHPILRLVSLPALRYCFLDLLAITNMSVSVIFAKLRKCFLVLAVMRLRLWLMLHARSSVVELRRLISSRLIVNKSSKMKNCGASIERLHRISDVLPERSLPSTGLRIRKI